MLSSTPSADANHGNLPEAEMKFTVGYQLAEEDEESFVDIVKDHRDNIAEVYFPWSDMPSGRASLSTQRGFTDWTAQSRLEEDLIALKGMGLKLDVLFNANCYGGMAVSELLQNQVVSVLDHLAAAVGGIDTVTTTSLAVARTVKSHDPAIEVRASVNMRIGTIQAMEHVEGLFDGFTMQRDFNRDLVHVAKLKKWADDNGKKLVPLLNSGCLRFCPGQTFHDNMVAHEKEVDETKNIPDWTPHVCWNLFKDEANWSAVLRATWIRPEDIHHYEDLFPLGKLATRMHARPRRVIRAYSERMHTGNLLDLLEPGPSSIFHPHVIDNTRFPDDWFKRTSECGGTCEDCDYCSSVLRKVLVRLG